MDWGSLLSDVLPGLVTGGANMLGNLYKPVNPDTTAQIDYEKWRDQFNAQQNAEIEKEKLAAEQAMAGMQAGATVRAAGLGAAAERDASLKRAQGTGLEQRIAGIKMLNPEVRNDAGKALSDQQAKAGETTQGGLLTLAQLLQNPLLRRSSLLQ